MGNDYRSGGGHTGGRTGGYQLTDYDRASADIPLWSWLSGAGARRDQLAAANAADTNRAYWDSLNSPSADQLMGPGEDRDAQMDALNQLQQWGNGGLTGTDRRMMESQRTRDSQATGAAQRSIQQQAQARGVGGSGLDYGTQMQAVQQGQQHTSDAESQMMASAQNRALAATQAQGNLAGDIRTQDVGATQQAFQDAATRAAGATGQYSSDSGTANSLRQQRMQEDQGVLGFLGTVLAA